MSRLRSFIRWVMRDVTYHRRYLAEVERRAPDGTFDLRPLDEPMLGRGLQGVRERVGLASAETIAVRPGARCLFGFANGDPQRPEIVAWEFSRGSATVSLDGGLAAIARKGDPVRIIAGESVSIVGIVAGIVTPPPPAAPFPVAGLPFTGTAALTGPIRADIIGGARRVKG